MRDIEEGEHERPAENDRAVGRLSEKECTADLQALAEAKKPKGHAELAILPGVEALVKTAVRM